MRRQRIPGVVYSGRVGAKLPTRRPGTVGRRYFRKSFRCASGPFAGRTIQLDRHSDHRTLPIVVRGSAGYYRGGSWVSAPCSR